VFKKGRHLALLVVVGVCKRLGTCSLSGHLRFVAGLAEIFPSIRWRSPSTVLSSGFKDRCALAGSSVASSVAGAAARRRFKKECRQASRSEGHRPQRLRDICSDPRRCDSGFDMNVRRIQQRNTRGCADRQEEQQFRPREQNGVYAISLSCPRRSTADRRAWSGGSAPSTAHGRTYHGGTTARPLEARPPRCPPPKGRLDRNAPAIVKRVPNRPTRSNPAARTASRVASTTLTSGRGERA
jgi:hypothetical protein